MGDTLVRGQGGGGGRAGRESFGIVGAKMLAGFAEVCAALGAGSEDLLAQAGIAAADGASSPASVTYPQFIDLLAIAASRLGSADFGMRLAIAQAGTDLYGPLGKIMQSFRTFGDALDYVVGHAHLHSPSARITRHAIPGRQGVLFSHEIIGGDFARQEQAMDHLLLAGHLGAMVLTGGSSRARQVLLRHRPVSAPAVYRRNFGCEVLFDQPLDGIVFGQADLARPIVAQEAGMDAEALAALADNHPVEAPPLAAAARAAILRLIQVGLADNRHVAAELGLGERALHRRLRASGTSFQQIKDEVRCELVRYYIRHEDLGFLWITGKLDFAEQAVFTRFCRRHLGASPTQLRAAARAGTNAAAVRALSE